MPIESYINKLPDGDNHPSRGLIAISEIAPSRTRGSFFYFSINNTKAIYKSKNI